MTVEECGEPVVVDVVRQTHDLPAVHLRVAAQRTTSVLLPQASEVAARGAAPERRLRTA